MRVLVTWGSKLGGTAGIAAIIGETLRRHGHDVVAAPAREVHDLDEFDAAVIGGALYAFRWHRDARRFVDRHQDELRRIPVWFFSSGPLDDSAERDDIPPRPGVLARMERVGALGHVTFGGRLEADVKGFPAQAMAKEHAGDWRNPARIEAWADDVARALPTAQSAAAIAPPGSSPGRLIGYALAGWTLCAAVLLSLTEAGRPVAATVLHAIAVPIVFAVVALGYFRPRGAVEPLPGALAFTVIFGALHAILIEPDPLRYWLPLALVFATTWATGAITAMMPFPKPAPAARPAAA